MRGPLLTLSLLGVSLAWVLFFRAGVYPEDWSALVLSLGAISAFYWTFRSAQTTPDLPAWHLVAIWALPCYLLFQLIPFPPAILDRFSPARAILTDALAGAVPGLRRAPISVNTPRAVFGFFSFLAYLATFFLVRDIAWRSLDRRSWAPVMPLLAVGSVEALIGLIQVALTGPATVAIGTYANPDHFCGLLEMTLPFAVLYGFVLLRRRGEFLHSSSRAAFAACAVWGLAIGMMAAIVYSGFRMGPLDILCSLALIAALKLGPMLRTRKLRLGFLGATAASLVLLFALLPPGQIVRYLTQVSSSEKVTAETRLIFWKETLPLLNEFRWFGTGLGGFDSNFLKYQGIATSVRVEMAQNDYLQYLVELGIIGFGILAAAIAGVVIGVIRGVLSVADEPRRLLLIACAGAFLSVALHSLVDFNMYIPANALALAWIAGVASANGLD